MPHLNRSLALAGAVLGLSVAASAAPTTFYDADSNVLPTAAGGLFGAA